MRLWASSWVAESQRAGPHGYIHGWIKVGAHARVTSGYHAGKEGHIVSHETGGNATLEQANGSRITTGAHLLEPTGQPAKDLPAPHLALLADLKPGDRVIAGNSPGRISKLRPGPHGIPGADVVLDRPTDREGYGTHWVPLTSLRPAKKAAARAAGMLTNPGGTERLHQYWVHGEGAAKIRWGAPGDFDRCVMHLGKFIKDPKGYCANAHHAALGIWPATHAKELKGRSGMADKKPEDQPDEQGRAESVASYVRAFPLEDISVRTTRDGRIVDAYLAVFNTPAPIHDQDGDYDEELDPVVFNKAISDARPQGTRASWRVGVFYNHGMTIMGTPSDRHSMPVAVPMDIRTDGHGVRATDKYHRSQFCDEIIEGLESGAIPGYSFSGRFLRSNPLIPRSGFRKRHDGTLPKVRRMESTLREYGPTPFPAYADAAVLGIRSDSLMAAMMQDPDTAMRMLAMFRDGTPPQEEPPPGSGTPQDEEPPPRSRTHVHSGRSVREQIQANTALLLQGQYRRD